MKQKLYLSSAAFFMLSFSSIAQLSVEKQVQPYFGQAGIKKKMSELLAVKPVARKQLDAAGMRLIELRSEKFSNLIKPDKKKNISGVPNLQMEEDTKIALRATSALSSTSTQQVWSNFLSSDFYENTTAGHPPYPHGAVGANQVIAATNSGIKVFDKPAVTDPPVVTSTGYSREMAHSTLSVTLDQFFSTVLTEGSRAENPLIRYDRLSKRWFVAATEINPPSFENNLILLAVSDGDKITDSSNFTFYSFNSSLFPPDSNATNAPFFYYITLGIDKHSVLIGGHLLKNNAESFVGYVINKEILIKGKLAVYPFELGSIDYATNFITGAMIPQGVYNDDPAAKKSFFIGINAALHSLVIANIEYNKKKAPILASKSIIQVAEWNRVSDVSSPGGLTPIKPINNPLLTAAIYKNKLTGNSSLWTAHTIGVNQFGGFINGSESDFVREARNGSRWYKIGNIYTKPGLLQSGTVYDAEEPSGRRSVQYFNPSIAASGQGHSIISGTTTAYNQYLNVFAAGRYFGDQLGKTKPPIKATNTTAIYAPYYFDEFGRKIYIGGWGYYSRTIVDPIDDQTIWTFQEYANVDDSYGIRVVQFKAPPPATPAAIGTLSNKSDTTITLEGESVNNSGFFDLGKDIGGPGYNRLLVKSTGSIIAGNIKFISPTKISFTLNTANKPAGQYLLIITNPDGQLVVTDYTITANTTALIAGNSLSAAKALRDKTVQAYITESSVYPNPTTTNATLQINAAKEHQARIVLINVDGKKVFERTYSFSKGSNQALLPTEKLTRGTYIAAVYNQDKVLIATQKIVKQ